MPNELPKVCIVMATYNGEEHLVDQLESIRHQIDVEVSVLVVDDGSTDSTLTILEDYRSNGLISRIIHTERIGHSAAFMTGLSEISAWEWVGFSDQDDVWDSAKIITAIRSSCLDEAVLVCGRRTYINTKNEVLGKSLKLRKLPNWRNALVENVCYGNTTLVNAAGIELLKRYKGFQPEVFDAWLYLVFALRGRIVYLEDSGTEYRLHSSNAIGVGRTWRIRSLIDNQRKLMKNGLLLFEFEKEDIDIQFKIELMQVQNFMARKPSRNLLAPIKLGFNRQKILDNFLLKLISPWTYSNHRV